MVLLALGAVFGGLQILNELAKLKPEIGRKLLHVGIGLICLSFPWLFHEAWPVVVLGLVASASLAIVRVLPRLRSSIGKVLHGVDRISLGEFYFVSGVTLLFVQTIGATPYFIIPMVWLTLADATAALIGVKYGTVRYQTHDGSKTLEGSATFAAVTFITTFISLVAWGHTNALQDGLLSAIAAILVMLLEAVSWDGIDNLVIPVFGYALLRTLIDLNVLELVLRLGILAVFVVAITWRRQQTSLADDALLAAVLSGYAFWALGGWEWLLAPAALFLKDKLQSRSDAEERRHDVHAVMATCGVGLALAALYSKFPDPILFYVYTLSFAIGLTVFELTLVLNRKPNVSRIRALAYAGVMAEFLLFGPYVLIQLLSTRALIEAGAGFVISISCGAIFMAAQPSVRDCPRDTPRWLRQTALVAGGSVVGAALAVIQ